LSKKSQCNVDIIVRNNSAVRENITLSWKNSGVLKIIPLVPDEESIRQFNSILQFHIITRSSYAARRNWFESNNKGINK
jgi:hypothetical protein